METWKRAKCRARYQKKKGKKRKKARRLGRHSKGHLPGVATPARLRSLRVFAPENSRSSYVTGSRGRSYGEVTMREDGCRLSDATLDKYLRCAPLPLQRFASPIGYRLVSFAVRLREPCLELLPSLSLFFPFFFTGSSSRDGGNFTRSPLFHDGENAQLQFSMLVRLCVCRYFSWLSGQVISSFPVFFFVSHASRTSSNSNWN